MCELCVYFIYNLNFTRIHLLPDFIAEHMRKFAARTICVVVLIALFISTPVIVIFAPKLDPCICGYMRMRSFPSHRHHCLGCEATHNTFTDAELYSIKYVVPWETVQSNEDIVNVWMKSVRAHSKEETIMHSDCVLRERGVF